MPGRGDAIVLRGADHVVYDDVAFAALDDRVAIGCTRGRHPKRYAYRDPNEDVVAAIAVDDAVILAVADGHNGYLASDVAVFEIVERAKAGRLDASWWTPNRLVELFAAVNERVLTEATDGSRTTLIVARVDARSLSFGAMGDSGIYVVRNEGIERLDRPRNDRFVGWDMTAAAIAASGTFVTVELDADADVVLASDGFIDFTRDERSVLLAARGAPTARNGVALCIADAFDGGAGDNVAVAVLRAPR